MASLEEIRKARLEKLEKIQKGGGRAYPGAVKRTHTAKEAVEQFLDLEKSAKEIIVVGRIRSMRGHGGSAFFNIEDGSASFGNAQDKSLTTGGTGAIQCFVKRDGIGEKAYGEFQDIFDIGDFAEVRGTVFQTQKGEKTIQVASIKMLAKSLLPLPEKWHGLQDEEERFRKRYLDLLFNPEVKKIFKTRAQIVQAIREFLDKEGFLEVETPVLQSMYGGADAQPFITHINAFDMDMYLRISLELPLKRLMVGGFEKVYEIGRVFRNEGVDRQHNPDFTLLEFYWAYADYKDNMKLTEQLFSFILQKVFGTQKIQYEGKTIDFTPPWPRVEYEELFRKYAKLDIVSQNKDTLLKEAKKLGLEVDETFSKGRLEDVIYKKTIRPNLWDPQFVIHHPAEMMPLAKARPEDSTKAETFQLLVGGGWELVKAYTEQNDPIVQRKAFEEQEGLFKKGLEDAQRMDEDFVQALEYGMPPTTGFGMGIDRLTALLTDSHSLREVILFPTMKPKDLTENIPQKAKESKIAVAVINASLGLERWKEMNTIAHLNAAFGARMGRELLFQDQITTRDNQEIHLNIQHAIMIKTIGSNKGILKLIDDAKAEGLSISEFTQEMIETTDDRKVIQSTKEKDRKDVTYLGVLVFGKKSQVERLTKDLKLFS